MVDDISHEGLRVLLREEGVSFQVIKTSKQSNDPDFEVRINRVLELYEIADGKAEPGPDDPTVVFCMDEFGPLDVRPRGTRRDDVRLGRPRCGYNRRCTPGRLLGSGHAGRVVETRARRSLEHATGLERRRLGDQDVISVRWSSRDGVLDWRQLNAYGSI